MLQVPPALLCLPARDLPEPPVLQGCLSLAWHASPGFPQWDTCHCRVALTGSLLSCGTRTRERLPVEEETRLRGESKRWSRGGLGQWEPQGRTPSSVPTKPLTSPPVEKQGRQGLKPQAGLAWGQVGRRETLSSLPFFTQVPHWQFSDGHPSLSTAMDAGQSSQPGPHPACPQ